MLNSQKRCDKLVEYFQNFSELRKFVLSTHPAKNYTVSYLRSLTSKINSKFTDLNISANEYDYFVFGFQNGNLKQPADHDHGLFHIYSKGKEIGYDGLIYNLWTSCNFETNEWTGFKEKINCIDKLKALLECSHFFNLNCELCLIKDSFFEGISGTKRLPSSRQCNKKHELIYNVGKDKYLDNKNLITDL